METLGGGGGGGGGGVGGLEEPEDDYLFIYLFFKLNNIVITRKFINKVRKQNGIKSFQRYDIPL